MGPVSTRGETASGSEIMLAAELAAILLRHPKAEVDLIRMDHEGPLDIWGHEVDMDIEHVMSESDDHIQLRVGPGTCENDRFDY